MTEYLVGHGAKSARSAMAQILKKYSEWQPNREG
jgi:hypothetical protein